MAKGKGLHGYGPVIVLVIFLAILFIFGTSIHVSVTFGG